MLLGSTMKILCYESLLRRIIRLESYLLEGKRDQEILHDFLGDEYYNKYVSIKNKISDSEYKDIYKLIKKEPNEVKKYIDDVQSKRALRKANKSSGANLIYSDNNWNVYRITTYDAAMIYGAGTKWCISGHYGEGEYNFNKYIERYNLDNGYYFYLSKNDPNEKYCILQNKNGDIVSIWDVKDFNIGSAKDNIEAELPDVAGVNLKKYSLSGFINSIKRKDFIKLKDYIDNSDISPQELYDEIYSQLGYGLDLDVVKFLVKNKFGANYLSKFLRTFMRNEDYDTIIYLLNNIKIPTSLLEKEIEWAEYRNKGYIADILRQHLDI